MAVKRRVIWMSDPEWAALQEIAKDRGDSISGVLRSFWATASRPRAEGLAVSQAQRDAILRRINK